MSAQWLSTRSEGAAKAQLSGEGAFYAALQRLWLCIALSSLAAAICWRTNGSAPDLRLALDCCGLALFASALWLLPYFERLLLSQQRHVSAGALWPGQLGAALLRLLGAALALSFAPAPLLLAYSAREMVVRIDRINAPALLVPLPLVFLASLAIGGCLYLLLSCLLLQLARRLAGLQAGSLIWLCCLFLLNLPLLSGLPEASLVALLPWTAWLSGGGGSEALQFPGMQSVRGLLLPGPGGYLDFSLNTLANRDAALVGIPQFVSALLGLPLLKIFGLLALFAALLALPAPRRSILPRLRPLWLAAAGSVLTAAMLSLLAATAWAKFPALRFPGDQQAIMAISMLVCLNLAWLQLCHGAASHGRAGQGLLLLLFAPPAWMLCTISAISADQAGARELLALALAALLIVSPLVLALLWLERSREQLGSRLHLALALLILLLINLPPQGSASLPVMLLRWLGSALALPQPAPLALAAAALLLLTSALLWPRARRSLRRRSSAEPAA